MIEADTEFDLYVDLAACTAEAVNSSGLFQLKAGRPKSADFCGLTLDRREAKRRILEMRGQGARGYPVPIRYRAPSVSVDDAKMVATPIIRDKQALVPDGRWGSITHLAAPMWWEFRSPSEKLAGDGWVPGAAIVVVDRCSAQLWSADAIERYFLQWDAQSELRLAELDLLSADPQKQLAGLSKMELIDDKAAVARSLAVARRLRPLLAEQIDAALTAVGTRH